MSTTAQSAAALVAIVGGLLVTRVATLKADREHLEQRRRELDAELTGVRVPLERDQEELWALEESAFSGAIRDIIVWSRGAASTDQLIADHGASWMTRDHLERVSAEM